MPESQRVRRRAEEEPAKGVGPVSICNNTTSLPTAVIITETPKILIFL